MCVHRGVWSRAALERQTREHRNSRCCCCCCHCCCCVVVVRYIASRSRSLLVLPKPCVSLSWRTSLPPPRSRVSCQTSPSTGPGPPPLIPPPSLLRLLLPQHWRFLPPFLSLCVCVCVCVCAWLLYVCVCATDLSPLRHHTLRAAIHGNASALPFFFRSSVYFVEGCVSRIAVWCGTACAITCHPSSFLPPPSPPHL